MEKNWGDTPSATLNTRVSDQNRAFSIYMFDACNTIKIYSIIWRFFKSLM